jgi:hypothetical protein
MDGKVLKGSYQVENDNPHSDSHKRNYVGQCLSCGARVDFGAL